MSKPNRSKDEGRQVRVGMGEFRDRNGWIAAKAMVQHFLDAASRANPEFHTDLTQHAAHIIQLASSRPGAHKELAFPYIRAVIEEWQQKHRVVAEWAGIAATLTVEAAVAAFKNDVPVPTRVLWPNPDDRDAATGYGLPRDDKFFEFWTRSLIEFEIAIHMRDRWRADQESKTAFKTRFLQEVEKRLDEQLSDIESKTLEDPNLLRTTERNADRFDWLARFLVGRENYYRIAKSAFPNKSPMDTRSNIKRGIQDAAADLGLTLPSE